MSKHKNQSSRNKALSKYDKKPLANQQAKVSYQGKAPRNYQKKRKDGGARITGLGLVFDRRSKLTNGQHASKYRESLSFKSGTSGVRLSGEKQKKPSHKETRRLKCPPPDVVIVDEPVVIECWKKYLIEKYNYNPDVLKLNISDVEKEMFRAKFGFPISII